MISNSEEWMIEQDMESGKDFPFLKKNRIGMIIKRKESELYSVK
jgi:hypothetical protein